MGASLHVDAHGIERGAGYHIPVMLPGRLIHDDQSGRPEAKHKRNVCRSSRPVRLFAFVDHLIDRRGH
jgi:hypothetical protein